MMDWLRTGRLGNLSLVRSNLPALLGLFLPLVAGLATQPAALILHLATTLVVTLFWQWVFARVRKQNAGAEGLVTAVVVALLVPAEAPVWQLMLGTTFGVVLGELVFGGRGRNFVHPAVVALTFLMFSFAEIPYRTGPELPAWTVVPALVLLIGSGQASWRLLLGAALGIVLLGWANGAVEPWAPLLGGSVLLALVFLAADPVASSSTNWGRPIYGLLIGVLAGLFSTTGAMFGAAIFAVLLGSIFAPLVDHLVVLVHMRWREGRSG